ncbi:MAG TPA: hypothetical protein VFM06_01860 [Candidatus Limnocylindria bacterium]|nr:hypothetical protein [Candidatus Limnocylindria bacterium]
MKVLVVVGEGDREPRAHVDELSIAHQVTVAATQPFDAPEGVRVERFERGGALLEHLHRAASTHDVVIFYGFEHEICAAGMRIVPERAALVPLVRDPLALGERSSQALFHLPRVFGFTSAAEEELVRARFRNGHIPGELLSEDGALERLLVLASQ